MNVAVITGAGTGARIHQDLPKQFLNVNNKPLIVYTLEAFQSHPDIDAIEVVCLEGWQEIVKAYANQFNITKLKWIVPGGITNQESTRFGLMNLKDKLKDDDIVLIHDGVRPIVPTDVISDCIVKTKQFGNAVAVTPCNEAMLISDNRVDSHEQISRDRLFRTQTPHGFKFKELMELHEEAISKGINSSVASCTLMIELGREMHFSIGSDKNFKITTTDDLEIFKALLKAEKDEWLK